MDLYALRGVVSSMSQVAPVESVFKGIVRYCDWKECGLVHAVTICRDKVDLLNPKGDSLLLRLGLILY
jgi:hypothetical protein